MQGLAALRGGRQVVQATVDSFIQAHQPRPVDGTPRRTWVYRQVLDAVREGRLPAGARLPSARQLSVAWTVPRGAVDEAFAQLQAEGLIERRVGQGSFVSAVLRQAATQARALADQPVDTATRQTIARLEAWTAEARVFTSWGAEALRLQPGVPDTAQFPLAAWRRELGRALAEEHRAALSYGLPAGVTALREAVARHLTLTRAIRCRPEQVLIVGSPRQGIELTARVLLSPGQCVCVEDPGPLSMTRRFSLAHLEVLGVPVDEQGFDVGHARQHAPQAAAVLLSPLHQWPTGISTSAARRRELLDWADAMGTWVVELDSLGEIVHDGAAPPALQAGDRSGRVIFVGSFGTVTFPALRIAYLVLPEALVDVFGALRGLMGEHNAVAMQMALAGFIDGGHLAGHVRAMRQLYRTRRDALVRAVERHLPAGVRLGPVSGGTHACLHLHAHWSDLLLTERLHRRGVGVLPLSRHSWQRHGLNGLLLGYGADTEADIDRAIADIAAELQAA